MILVREVFRLKFGKAKEAKALWKELPPLQKKLGHAPSKAYVELVGPYYTFVMETSHETLAAFEKALKDTLGAAEFVQWYQRFMPLVESGAREIYTMVE